MSTAARPMSKLIDKVVVVTGANRGIGRAIAERFAREGASVVLAGRNAAKLQAVARDIESRRGKAHAVVCDVTREEDVQKLVEEAISRYNGLDIMINNAGVMVARNLADTTTEDYDLVVDTNLKGVYLGCREAFKVMKARGGGVIINLSSVAGKEAWAGLGLYSASKFGLMGMTYALADEGTRHNIKVSALCPGAVATDLMKSTQINMGELIQPEDVAEAALYLATLPKNVVVKDMVLGRKGADA